MPTTARTASFYSGTQSSAGVPAGILRARFLPMAANTIGIQPLN